jgi:PAS domain S-box-containing protein
MLFDGTKGITLIAEDTTQEKSAEEKLKQSEKLYKAIVEDQNDLICRIKPDLTITFVNQVYCSYFNKSSKDLEGNSFMPLIPKEDRQIVEDALSSLSKENITARCEHRVIAPKGIRWLEWTVRAIYNQDNLTEYQGVGRDITKQKEYAFDLLHKKDFEQLIIDLSSFFLQDNPNKIHEALKQIGTFADVDRSYVFQFDIEHTLVSNTYEWCRKGVKAQKDNLQELPVEMFKWSFRKLKQFETIHIPRVSEMSTDAQAEKEILEKQDIKSIILVPLVKDEQLIGFMGFDSVRKIRKWSSWEIALLKVVAQFIVNNL